MATSLTRKAQVFLRDRFTCQFCGRSALKGDVSILELTLDHFSPQELGGNNAEENLLCCCKTCNHTKGGATFDTVEEARSYVVSQRARREKRFISNTLVAVGYEENRYDLMDLCFAVGGKVVTQ